MSVNSQFRAGDHVRYAQHYLDAIYASQELRTRTGTVVWVEHKPDYALATVTWHGEKRGATRVNIKNLEKVTP